MTPTGSATGTRSLPSTFRNPSVLEGHAVLTGDDRTAFHRLTRALFEERGVYDATFGYNLAPLNLDRRHPSGRFRYAVDADDRSVLRAEFTDQQGGCHGA
ncbi:hypothetical protein [Natronorubrum tibetense]|uniref:DUF7998 domain-containing protein n=1 Tax=Natronorubrum tibetense GA33 TaxID=1114856 RepID=L9VN52_9EURY|nr:hypothetical protein C496_17357 [Natronorubrum tibetense GA33]